MKLRIALKICRDMFDQSRPWHPHPIRRWKTRRRATVIGRKKWRDRRFPLIDTDEEMQERFETTTFLLQGAMDGSLSKLLDELEAD